MMVAAARSFSLFNERIAGRGHEVFFRWVVMFFCYSFLLAAKSLLFSFFLLLLFVPSFFFPLRAFVHNSYELGSLFSLLLTLP